MRKSLFIVKDYEKFKKIKILHNLFTTYIRFVCVSLFLSVSLVNRTKKTTAEERKFEHKRD